MKVHEFMQIEYIHHLCHSLLHQKRTGNQQMMIVLPFIILVVMTSIQQVQQIFYDHLLNE